MDGSNENTVTVLKLMDHEGIYLSDMFSFSLQNNILTFWVIVA